MEARRIRPDATEVTKYQRYQAFGPGVIDVD